MRRHLVDVPVEFVHLAPLRLTCRVRVAAAPAEVYRALAEGTAGRRGPRLQRGANGPRATGAWVVEPARRGGGPVVRGTVLAARPGEHYAYRADEVRVPGVRALVADWRLTPGPTGGTRVVRTLALDVAPVLRVLAPLARPWLGGTFRRSMRELDARLEKSRE
ncbi:SRPBCC family protein [Streptomyces chumphonensis]|uniref:SRPBCC family protein n=1 Tax=Streptomyces chumphonensis TaxID=1214925 RepID=A0A927EX57_9ACTN|nr:SRPBCC family protein [Streptomyces chumphonensis]MBD3931028.1 SRPBCC family protein [Streptomyces chumphonensis]